MLADLYSTRGSVHYECNAVDHGLLWTTKALEIRKAVARMSGDDHDGYLQDITESNLALALLAQGRLQQAKPLIERMLTITRETGFYGVHLSNISICYRLIGDSESALEYAMKGIDVISSAYGPKSSTMAMSVSKTFYIISCIRG